MPKDVAQQDSFFKLLESEIAKERSAGNRLSARFVRLATLMALHCQDEKTTQDGWKATLLAGHVGIPAPTWAIDFLQQAESDSIAGFTNIEVALGFKQRGKGQLKNAAVQRAIQERLREDLCSSVRLLISSGVPIKSACQMVAKKLKETTDWNDTVYPLRAPNADSLRKAYSKWERDRGQEVLEAIDKAFDSVPRVLKEKILENFR